MSLSLYLQTTGIHSRVLDTTTVVDCSKHGCFWHERVTYLIITADLLDVLLFSLLPLLYYDPCVQHDGIPGATLIFVFVASKPTAFSWHHTRKGRLV